MGVRAFFAVAAVGCVIAGCSDGNATGVVVVTPVNSSGQLSPGWTVNDKTGSGSIDCSAAAPSPFDVTHGVLFCGATADDGAACWPKDDAHVYCLIDPHKKTLKLVDATGLDKPIQRQTYPPTPALLVLDDGTECRARIGGAWSNRPDGTAPTHGCGMDTGDFLAVWATPGANGGIHKGSDEWTVDVGTDSGPLTRRRVATAYFVGMG
jgi:hypothetical protein